MARILEVLGERGGPAAAVPLLCSLTLLSCCISPATAAAAVVVVLLLVLVLLLVMGGGKGISLVGVGVVSSTSIFSRERLAKLSRSSRDSESSEEEVLPDLETPTRELVCDVVVVLVLARPLAVVEVLVVPVVSNVDFSVASKLSIVVIKGSPREILSMLSMEPTGLS